MSQFKFKKNKVENLKVADGKADIQFNHIHYHDQSVEEAWISFPTRYNKVSYEPQYSQG